MLIEDLQTPLLLIALDNLTEQETSDVGALSVKNAKETEKTSWQSSSLSSQYKFSDLLGKIKRIRIPINDRLLPIHYIAGNTSNNSIVDYFDKDAQLQQGSNQINLSFEIINTLSKISTIANIFQGLSGYKMLVSSKPRISFFSASLSVMNAYLVSINRSSILSTEQEVITLTLEVAPESLKKVTDIEKIPTQESFLKNTSV